MTIAMLTAGAALLGGGQLLAPSTALGEASNGPTCVRVTWFDQFTCPKVVENLGGGKDEDVVGEVIHVRDPKCGDVRVICVPVGKGQTDRPFSDPDNMAVDESGRGGKAVVIDDPDFAWDPDLTREIRHEFCVRIGATIKEESGRLLELENRRTLDGIRVSAEKAETARYMIRTYLKKLEKKQGKLKCGRFWA